MSSSQMNKSLSTSSDIQVRYHKAIKQISKLININTGLKKQSDYFKNICNQLQNEINRNRFEIENLKKEYNHLAQDSRVLHTENQTLMKELRNKQNLPDKKNHANVKNVNENQNLLNELREENKCLKQKQQTLKERLEGQGQTIIDLQEKLGTRNQQNNKLNKQIENLQNKNQELQKQIQQIKSNKTATNSYPSECINCRKMKSELNKAQQWVNKMNEENIALKKNNILKGHEISNNFNHRGAETSKYNSSFSYLEALQLNYRESENLKKEQILKLKRIIMKKQNQISNLKFKLNQNQKLINKYRNEDEFFKGENKIQYTQP